ncbi:MAG: single-stranded DNA-binding protein [Candidatus Obscuribacterales bacterium]|jgi:single-strand DNA-binding protein|nr:single-stranded DNA-binding protein [Candidatus Obscuribacterales bacterium]
MNQVHLIGNIGTEPEIKTFASGKRVARFSIAINSYAKTKEKRQTTWVPVEMWDAAVERLLKCKEKAALKGRKVQVTGLLALNEYVKTVGETSLNQRKLYVKVLSFQLLGGLEQADELPAEPASAEVAEAKPKTRRTRKSA